VATQIDVRENEAFENGWFIASTIALAIMTACVFAALTGVLGGGPLARASLSLPGRPVTVRYERFVRTQTPTRMDIAITGDLGSTAAEVHMDNKFLAARDIKDVLPRPDATRVDDDGITYLFALGPQHKGQISFWLTPNSTGFGRGTLAINGVGAALDQFIYP
jgi:hypothetical protein